MVLIQENPLIQIHVLCMIKLHFRPKNLHNIEGVCVRESYLYLLHFSRSMYTNIVLVAIYVRDKLL